MHRAVSIENIIAYMTEEYGGAVRIDKNWGERAVFYSHGSFLTKGVNILTFKELDGPSDKRQLQTERMCIA